jgi:hypothetical protein
MVVIALFGAGWILGPVTEDDGVVGCCYDFVHGVLQNLWR